MSSPGPPSVQLMGLEQCGICMDRKSRMKALSGCRHEFCESCLDSLIRSSLRSVAAARAPDDVKGECPLCRQHFPIPRPAGPHGPDKEKIDLAVFPTNHYGAIKCDKCREEKPTKDVWWCNKCESVICSFCEVDQHAKERHRPLLKFTSREPLKRVYRHMAAKEEGSPVDPTAKRFKADILKFFSDVAEEVLTYTDGGSYAEYREELTKRLRAAYGTHAEETTSLPPPQRNPERQTKNAKAKPAFASFQDDERALKCARQLLDLAEAPLPTKFGKEKLREDLPFLSLDPRTAAYCLLGIAKEDLIKTASDNRLKRKGKVSLEIPDFRGWVGGGCERKYGNREPIRGLSWSIDTTLFVGHDASRHLSVFANCRLDDGQEVKKESGQAAGPTKRWSCKAVVKVRLIPKRSAVEPVERSFTHVFGNDPIEGRLNNNGRGYPRFVQIERIIDPSQGFLDRNGSLELELEIHADLPVGIAIPKIPTAAAPPAQQTPKATNPVARATAAAVAAVAVAAAAGPANDPMAARTRVQRFNN